jgi:hypothetical protein
MYTDRINEVIRRNSFDGKFDVGLNIIEIKDADTRITTRRLLSRLISPDMIEKVTRMNRKPAHDRSISFKMPPDDRNTFYWIDMIIDGNITIHFYIRTSDHTLIRREQFLAICEHFDTPLKLCDYRSLPSESESESEE